MLRGAGCGPVHCQGSMGTCQLEIELGRGGKARWARSSGRKGGQREVVSARVETGWQGVSWGHNLSRGGLPWVKRGGGTGLADQKWGSKPSNLEDEN